MQREKQKNEIKRHEAWLVYGALMVRFIDLFYCDKGYILEISSAICTWCYMRRCFQIHATLFSLIFMVFDDTSTFSFCCRLTRL